MLTEKHLGRQGNDRGTLSKVGGYGTKTPFLKDVFTQPSVTTRVRLKDRLALPTQVASVVGLNTALRTVSPLAQRTRVVLE